MTTIKSKISDDQISSILQNVEKKASRLDKTLAIKVIRRNELCALYPPKNPYVFRVPPLGALLGGRWHLFFSTRQIWSAPDMKHREKHPGGLTVIRGQIRGTDPHGEPLPDKDNLTLEELMGVGEPEFDYIWPVRFIRQVQILINIFGELFGWEELELLDWYGGLYYQVEKGEKALFIDMVEHPEEVHDWITTHTKRIGDGDKALETLLGRADPSQPIQEGIEMDINTLLWIAIGVFVLRMVLGHQIRMKQLETQRQIFARINMRSVAFVLIVVFALVGFGTGGGAWLLEIIPIIMLMAFPEESKSLRRRHHTHDDDD